MTRSTVNATDAFKVFSNITLAALVAPVGAVRTPAPGSTGSSTPPAGQRRSGRSPPATPTVQATSFGDTAMNLLQLTTDTELGELYVDGSGKPDVPAPAGAPRRHAAPPPSQAVFGDSPGTVETDGTERPYTRVMPRRPTTRPSSTTCRSPRVGGNLQEATDSDIDRQVPVPAHLPADRPAAASRPRRAELRAMGRATSATAAENRFDTLTITPACDPANLFPQALGREIGDRPGVAAAAERVRVQQGLFHPGHRAQLRRRCRGRLSGRSVRGEVRVVFHPRRPGLGEARRRTRSPTDEGGTGCRSQWGRCHGASALNAVTLTSSTATTYTPTIANGGTATFTTNTGWYFEIGASVVFFTAYFVGQRRRLRRRRW